MMIAGDVYRPAAIDQLVILGEQVLFLLFVKCSLSNLQRIIFIYAIDVYAIYARYQMRNMQTTAILYSFLSCIRKSDRLEMLDN